MKIMSEKKEKYQEYFKKKMAKEGADEPSDVKNKGEFFKKVDKDYNSEDEKGKDGEKDEKDESRTRAGRLLANNSDIEEDFYKTRHGDTHRSRKENGMGNVTARNTSNSSRASQVTSAVNVTSAKPGV